MSIHSFFFREKPGSQTATNQAESKLPTSIPTTQLGLETSPNASRTSEFIESFKSAIFSKETLGIKFIKSLYTISQEPSQKDFQTAFGIIQTFYPNTTVNSIIESLSAEESYVKDQATKYKAEGSSKKTSLEANRASEKQKLQEENSSLSSKISEYEHTLEQMRSQKSQNENRITQIDEKYQNEISQVSQTIASVEEASSEVLSSLANMKELISKNI